MKHVVNVLATPAVAGTSPTEVPRLVLTLKQRDALKEDGRSIAVLPAWEWLD